MRGPNTRSILLGKRVVIPVAAAAALCAAAVPVSVHLTADRRPAGPPAAAPRAAQAGPAPAASLTQAIARARVAARPLGYTVRPGDSLSSIAGRYYGRPSAWPVLYWANRGRVRWADVIEAGEVLAVPAEPAVIPAAPGQLEPPAPRPVPSPVLVAYTVPVQVPVKAQAAPVRAAAVSTTGESAFEQCIISRESGGNAHAVNPVSGAGGIFQFLPSTWASLGYSGLPEDAPVAEQYAAFDKLYAEDGGSPWLADHCPGT